MFKVYVTLDGLTFVATVVDGQHFLGPDPVVARATTAHGAVYALANTIEGIAKMQLAGATR